MQEADQIQTGTNDTSSITSAIDEIMESFSNEDSSLSTCIGEEETLIFSPET